MDSRPCNVSATGLQGGRSCLTAHICRKPSRHVRLRLVCQNSNGKLNGNLQDDAPILSRMATIPTNYTDANFPIDDQGRTYHLGTKRGEVANRILSVGSVKRALMLSELLDPPKPGGELFFLESSRGFITMTGLYRGVPVSIICTHMGMPNMDFVMRETRAVVDGPMAVVRLGTCGGLRPPAVLGKVVLAAPGSISVRRDPDAFTLNQAALLSMDATNQVFQQNAVSPVPVPGPIPNENGALGDAAPSTSSRSTSGSVDSDALTPNPSTNLVAGPMRPYYIFSLPVPSDPSLTAGLEAELNFLLGEGCVVRGMNASADSFYSSQGRTGIYFQDHNSDLMEELTRTHPECLTLEMETFHLLDLARCTGGSIVAAAAAIVLAERHTNEFMDSHRLYTMERAAGTACLNALAKAKLPVHQSNPRWEYVWE